MFICLQKIKIIQPLIREVLLIRESCNLIGWRKYLSTSICTEVLVFFYSWMLTFCVKNQVDPAIEQGVIAYERNLNSD